MSYLIQVIQSVILGIIQGITEWLPISSTGHLLLFDSIWPMKVSANFFEVFKVVIQFGSILAVLVLYWHKLNPWAKGKNIVKQNETFKLWTNVIIGCIPAGIAGLALDNIIEGYLSANFVIAITLIAYGIIFIVISKYPKKPKITNLNELTWRESLGIGCFQCLALIPGTSRSGATILGGLQLGCSRYVASEFSFFIAIPVMIGASGLKIVKYLTRVGMFTGAQLGLLAIGTLVAFVVSLFAIRGLLNYVKNHTFAAFGWYRIILGILVLFFFYMI